MLAVPCILKFLCMSANVIAFQSDSSGFVSLIGYTQVAYVFMADYAIFGLEINAIMILCTILILGTTVTVSVFKLIASRKENTEGFKN
jgi:hypothetical protein